jgi:hypothetical protein
MENYWELVKFWTMGALRLVVWSQLWDNARLNLCRCPGKRK